MQDDLQKAYSAYQQALYLLPNPKEDPKLWYGIGILRPLWVTRPCRGSVRQNEILFRLGII